MDYERKYKDALSRARQEYNTTENIERKQWLEDLYPELVESEDERIRKELINFIKRLDYINRLTVTPNNIDKYNTWITWLEKQGEYKSVDDIQKPTYMVEPRFKVGDYIKHDKANIIYKVVSVNSGYYYVENIETDSRIELFNAEQNFHLWTIQDAKDGDVLATDDGNIFVFDGTVEEDKYSFAYYGLTRRRFESYDRRLPFTHNNVHPATKEQRDQLEKAMADAGYTFDFEKKELRKIEQKHTWSIEDEQNLNAALSYIDDEYIRRWLKDAIYNKYRKPVWSEEDERIYQSIINDTVQENQLDSKQIDWLKSMKSRVKPDQEWRNNNE